VSSSNQPTFITDFPSFLFKKMASLTI